MEFTKSELVDRLSITQLKEVFITDHKKEYAEEISDILHDIDLLISENKVIQKLDIYKLEEGNFIRNKL